MEVSFPPRHRLFVIGCSLIEIYDFLIKITSLQFWAMRQLENFLMSAKFRVGLCP